MFGVPRQVKGPKPWPLHPWQVSFYDGKWRCQVGVVRDEDYTDRTAGRTFNYSVQNVRQNSVQYGNGSIRNDKGGSNNPKHFILSETAYACGNKIYQEDGTEAPDDGCVKWGSGAFSSTNPTHIILRKVDGTPKKWTVIALANDGTWLDEDICIARIEPTSGSPSGWLVAQVLKSDVFITPAAANEKDHPFLVVKHGKHLGVTQWKVITGMVNNVVPSNMQSILSVENGWVWVQCNYDDVTKFFPKSSEVYIGGGAALPSTDVNSSYVALAQIINGVSHQLVTSSLWGDRLQVGSGVTAVSAQYFYARV